MKSKFLKKYFILLLLFCSPMLFSQNYVATQENNADTSSWLIGSYEIWLSVALIAIIIIGSANTKKS